MELAIDWDGVCVDRNQDWLPGSKEALRRILSMGHRVVIHTCRANWPEGLASVEAKLLSAGLLIPVWTEAGKPPADVYLDDRGVHFDGDWQPLLASLEKARTRNRRAGSVKTRPRVSGWH